MHFLNCKRNNELMMCILLSLHWHIFWFLKNHYFSNFFYALIKKWCGPMWLGQIKQVLMSFYKLYWIYHRQIVVWVSNLNLVWKHQISCIDNSMVHNIKLLRLDCNMDSLQAYKIQRSFLPLFVMNTFT
jgi:hypothetical protein